MRALAQRAAEGQARAERAQWAAQWRGQTLEAMRASQWDAARVAARRWLEMAPGDGEAVQAQQTIADSMAVAQKAASAASAPARQSAAGNQPTESAVLTPVSPSTAADARQEQSQAGEERQRGEETEPRRREAELEARIVEDEARQAVKYRAEADAEWARHEIQDEAATRRRSWLWVTGGIALLALVFAVLHPSMGGGVATPASRTDVSLGTTQLPPDTPTPTPTEAPPMSTQAAAPPMTIDALSTSTMVPPTPTTESPPQLTVKAQLPANVRNGPGTGYDIIGQLPPSETRVITGRTAASDWWQIDFSGKPGWVSNLVVKIDQAASKVPIVTIVLTPSVKTLRVVAGDTFSVPDQVLGDDNVFKHSIVNGRERWEMKAGNCGAWWFWDGDQNDKRFVFAEDIRLVSGPDDSEVSLMFRRTNNDHYLFSLRGSAFSVRLYRGDELIPLIDWTQTATIKNNELNRFTVDGDGSYFKFFINGTLVGDIRDQTLPSGVSGIHFFSCPTNQSAIWELDNWELRAPY